MADDELGPYAPIVSVRRGRNQLPDEDRALLEQRRRQRGASDHGHDQGSDHHGGAGYANDVFRDDISVLGIPKEEMTEHVRHAIGTLLDEINRLRAELMHVRGHEAYLEEQVEKDRMLHVMRRRAFLARLNLAARHVADEQVSFSFVYLAIQNAQSVRARFGHGAAEKLMALAAEVLRECATPGDVVGSLENLDFGVLLPGTVLADAREKAQAFTTALGARTFVWQGETLDIQAGAGVAEVAPNDSGDEIIARAKRDLNPR